MNTKTSTGTINMKLNGSLLAVLFFVVTGFAHAQTSSHTNPLLGLSDQNATQETKALFVNLKQQMGHGILFGQQHAFVNTQAGKKNNFTDLSSSDFVSATHDLPAVHGYNFLSLIDFRKKEFKGKRQIAALYKKGVIITIHLPIGNPATNGGSSDSAGHPIQQLVVANSVANLRWNGWLDQIATYLNTLNADGVKIPILFRPFHEMNGGGNWYGAKHCSPAEFIAAWKYTVDYLRKTRGVNNILLVYAPNKLDKAGYLDRYAGDQYVDVMAFDNYDRTITNDPFDIAGEAESAVAAAHAHHKIAAIAETGHKEGIQLYKSNDWYMQHLLKPLLASKSAAQVAYIMTWTNRSEGYWVPLPGQEGYADFQSFVTNEAIVLNNRMKNMYVMPTELP